MICGGEYEMENEKNQPEPAQAQPAEPSIDAAQDDEKPDLEQAQAATTVMTTMFKLVFQKSSDGASEPTLIKVETPSRSPTPNATTCPFPPDEGCATFESNKMKRGSSVEVEIGSCSSLESPGKSLESGSSADSTPQKVPLPIAPPASPASASEMSAAAPPSVSVFEKLRELHKRVAEREPYSSDAESPKKKPRGKVTPRYRHPVRKSKKAGLSFPVGRVHRRLKEENTKQRISVTGAVYLASVMEYMTAELMETSGNVARDAGRKRITPRDILLAVGNDEDMDDLFRQQKVMIPGSGAVPSTDRFLKSQRFPEHLFKKRQMKKRVEEEEAGDEGTKKPKKK